MNYETDQIFILNPSINQANIACDKVVVLNQVNLEDVENFTNVCRICAAITEYLVPVFEGEGMQCNLADKINKHLPIQVTESDMLPRWVCYQCTHTLLAWHELYTCAVQANEALNTRLAQINAKQAQQEQEPAAIIETQKVEDKDKSEKVPKEQVKIASEEVNQDSVEQKRSDVERPSNVNISEDGKRYVKCTVCEKNVSVLSWRRHFRSHQGDKRYSCHSCGVAFSDSGNLARHSRNIHAKQRPFSCEICQKTFSRNSHLQDHIKSHYESRNFVCDLCGKASKSSAALRMHRRRHESECKFGCLECEAKFKSAGELRAHLTVHTGERIHSCHCGKSFRLRSQLNTHLKIHDKQPKES